MGSTYIILECLQMTKYLAIFLAVSISVSVLFSGCSNSQKLAKADDGARAQVTASSTPSATPTAKATETPKPTVDLAKVKPNEDGKIMVVMFHNFVQSFTPKPGDNGEYTTTFDDFRKLLPMLYDKGYRLINVNDYLNNNINVAAGCIPMMFTFDDGTAGQFNLVEENGKLVANKQSAVGILEEFNRTHPDFGLKATFYVNLGLNTFEGKGTVADRLKYLVDEGFEIGNHTMTHIHLNEQKSADNIIKEVGGNQKKMLELIPGYQMKTLALPFGQATKDLQGYVVKGEYSGVKYENFALMEVGAGPTMSPVSKKSNPLSMSRVRATGMKPVDCDLGWWLPRLSRDDQYISDGDPNTVTVPKSKEADVDKDRLKGKQLVIY